MNNIDKYEQQILSILDVQGGFTTGNVAKKVTPRFGRNGHQHIGAVRSWLIDLEKKGLVKRMDDQKPVCWMLQRNAT